MWLQLTSVALVAVPCCREYLLFIINIIINGGGGESSSYLFLSFHAVRNSFILRWNLRGRLFLYKFRETRPMSPVCSVDFIFFYLFLLCFYILFFFVYIKLISSTSRTALFMSVLPVILFLSLPLSLSFSRSLSLSLYLSPFLRFSRSFSHPFFLLKCNLQLLYNMTENTLDHDNTIIIVLFFTFF